MTNKKSFIAKTRFFLTALIMIFSSSILLMSCDEDEAPGANIKLDKHGAIDMSIKTTHYTGFDVLTIERMVYNESGVCNGVRTFIDTMPCLSMVIDTLSTGREYVDDNGDTHDVDTLVKHPKNYQIYISVK